MKKYTMTVAHEGGTSTTEIEAADFEEALERAKLGFNDEGDYERVAPVVHEPGAYTFVHVPAARILAWSVVGPE